MIDPRFATDPFLETLDCCSLLAVPVLVQQRAIAVVLASHDRVRGVFGPDLVRSVELLCGHLAAAVENLLIQRSLERQVRERSRALREVHAREARHAKERQHLLEQKLKTSLAASAVVHEIQQPLSFLLLNSRLAIQTLESLPSGAVPEPLVEQLQQLTASGEQITTTMDRMRMLLRNVQTEHAAMDLAATLHSSVVFLQNEWQRQGVSLNTAGLDRVVPFQGDGAQLQIAAVNLIRNALQAMESQPVGRRRLRLDLQTTAEHVRIRVADSGPGFPDGFRGDTSWEVLRSTKAAGMGIGLFLVETAVSNHSGRLEIGRSDDLGGAEVVLHLPRHP